PGHFVRAQGSGGDPNAPHQNRAPKASAKASASEHAIHGMQVRLQNFILLRALCLALFSSAVSAAALESGDLAPDFSLTSYAGQKFSLSEFKDKIIVLEWFNAGCPFVMKHYNSSHMQKLQEKYRQKGVVWITINSTNPNHLDYLTAEKAQSFIDKHKLAASHFAPDPEGEVGKKFGAKTTPAMYVIDTSGKIAYSGAIDSERDLDADPNKTENYVAAALDSLLQGKAITIAKTSSYGCSVKYAG
ncbi:MAG: hypothetical protein DCC75_12425, partial [Proteobacteria bacterium]